VYAQSWSEAAAQKIERAGGQILAPADEAVAETDGEA
jgi:ribosomal protein L18E